MGGEKQTLSDKWGYLRTYWVFAVIENLRRYSLYNLIPGQAVQLFLL